MNAFQKSCLCYTIVLMVLLIGSCSTSEDPDPNKHKPLPVSGEGFLEEIINSNPEFITEPIRKDLWGYKETASFRGYVVVPARRIRITHIGGMIAQPGEYPFDIFERTGFNFPDTLMINHPLTIINTNAFEYQEVEQEIILEPDTEYVFRYYNMDHSSVYDVHLPIYLVREYEEAGTSPWGNEDVAMTSLHFYYTFPVDNPYEGSFEHGYATTVATLRGLVDFKYEVVE